MSSLKDLAEARALAKSSAGRLIRQGNHLSLADVAKAVGVSPVTVMRWEAGRATPRAGSAIRYQRLLEELARR